MKRNLIVISVTVLIVGLLCLAGWANWQNRKQAADHQKAVENQAVLIPDNASPNGIRMESGLLGKPAPAFTLTNLKGEKVSLASYKGKAVQLNFWATWCAPCRIETPWLVQLRNQYAPQGFEILAVSVDELDKEDKTLLAKEKSDIGASAQKLGITYPVLIDGDSISKPYGDVDVYPTSIFVDRSGNVVGTSAGLTSKDELESNIKKALASTSPQARSDSRSGGL